MKSLSTCLESILDDNDTFLDLENDKKVIEDWINDNYDFAGKLTISDDLVVDCNRSVIVKNRSITSLTNGLFKWGKVGGIFACSNCRNLTSLEGAPKEVGNNFSCHHCDNLKNLKGSPEIVKGSFLCHQCKSLIDLNGAPKRVFDGFNCGECENLKSLKGAPEKVGTYFYCGGCPDLKITDSDREKYKI